jgi:glycosyltransferase involved in cell wall biosynthesis
MNEPLRPRRKIILDIAPLGYCQDQKTGFRGVHRVSRHLFEGLLASKCYDLRFVSTSHLAGAYDLLSVRGLRPEESLNLPLGQLQFARLGRSAARWVHSRLTVPGLAARARRGLMARFAAFACSGEKWIPSRFLDEADVYHSPLAPIPSSVRNHPKISHFLTIHDLLPLTNPQILKGDPSPYIKKLLGSLSPKSFVFCVSETVKSDLLNFTAHDPNRIFITPLAADRNIFFPVTEAGKISAVRKKYGIPEAPYFLTLSSFDPRKNFGHIIRCFSQLIQSRKVNDCSLVIVGSNPERNRFVEEAVSRHPQIVRHLIMPGFVPDHDLAAIYSGALAFLFPSFGEGFGLPVLEAMQCGTPVISSNTTSLPEVIGDAGILLDPKDVEAWCHAITNLSGNSAMREQLQQKGIARAALFTWEKFMEATERGYAFACESR